MRSVAFFFLTAFLVLTLDSFPAAAQTVATRYDVVPIRSAVYSQTRYVFVYTPKAAPAGATALPVVYLPEADAKDSACFEQLEQLMQAGTLPYMRMVGIERNKGVAAPAVFNSPRSLGDPAMAADEWYYRFIAGEVVPVVEAQYRCSPFRTLCIDENTQFGFYMLHHQSRSFSAYLNLAPFFWLNEVRRPLSAKTFQAYYAGWQSNALLVAAADDSNGDEFYLKTGRHSWIKQ